MRKRGNGQVIGREGWHQPASPHCHLMMAYMDQPSGVLRGWHHQLKLKIKTHLN
jgi:hypothetical protein